LPLAARMEDAEYDASFSASIIEETNAGPS